MLQINDEVFRWNFSINWKYYSFRNPWVVYRRKEFLKITLVSQNADLSFSRGSSLHDYLQLNHITEHYPDTSELWRDWCQDHFPREPVCKRSGSRLFHKVFQRNQFLLTSLIINHHFWASKYELYAITNLRARFQSYQTSVFSHFKRCLGARDLESQFHFWICSALRVQFRFISSHCVNRTRVKKRLKT